MHAAIAWAKGADRLSLQVWEFNQEARAFYQQLGLETLQRTMALPLVASQGQDIGAGRLSSRENSTSDPHM
jgi:hypothetical protein